MSHEVESAKDFSIWTGGFIYWLLSGCRDRLKVQYSQKYERRNFLTGAIVLQSLVLLAIYLFFSSLAR